MSDNSHVTEVPDTGPPPPDGHRSPWLRSRLAGRAIRSEKASPHPPARQSPTGWQTDGSWQSPPWLSATPTAPSPPTYQWPPQAQPGPWAGPGYSYPWPQPRPWPQPWPWAGPQVAWPLGEVPWGYKNPPALPPVLEAPGRFHPPVSRRPVLSLKGRQAPRLYSIGLAVGLPAIALLLAYLVAIAGGFKLAAGPVAPWLIVEGVCIAAAAGLICWAVAQGRQRRTDGWRDYNGPSPFLMAATFLALITACELPLGLALKALQVDVQSPPATLLVLLLYLASYFGLVHFLAVRTGALTWHDIASPRSLAPSTDDWGGSEPARGWTRAWGIAISELKTRISGGRIADLLVGLAVVLPLIVASNLFAAGMLLVLGLKPSDLAQDQVVSRDLLSFLLTLIAVAVVAPIGEEVFFRGFATNAWGRSLSHNSAILRSSLFFAFIHIMNTATTSASLSWRVAIFNFAARVPVAFALTWLYMRRRSILASGTLHAGYNGLITIFSFL